MNWTKSLFLILVPCTLLFNSCTSIDLYEKTVSIPGHSWKNEFKPSFTFTIKDTAAVYQLFVVLRHNDKYSFNNIYINLYCQAPGQEEKKIILQEVKSEQKKILADAKQYGEKVKADMLVQSQKQVTEMVESGKVAIEQDRKAVQKELAQYVKETAEIAVQKGLATYLNDETRKDITTQVNKKIKKINNEIN